MAVRAFKFRPARRVAPALAGILGGALLVSSLLGGQVAGAIVGGVALALAPAYFASPAWRTEVRVDDDGLEVVRAGRSRLRLRWTEVVAVTAARASGSGFVDGGAPARSLLLPGPGARAAYRIADQGELLALICARVALVAPDRVVEVDRLRAGARPAAPPREA